MRVYLPATLAMLMRLNETGRFDSAGGTAFALTPALRESYSSGDDEELGEAALREAARASLRLIAAEGDGVPVGSSDPDTDPSTALLPPRRAVIAADIDDVTLRPDLDVAVVRIPASVPLDSIASVHVDLADAQSAVTAAVEVIDEADLGDEDAELAVGDVDDFDLAWYAPGELPFLLELL